MKRTVSGIMLTLLLIGMLVLAFNIQPAKSSNPEVLFFDDFNDGVADGWTEHLGSWNVINGEYRVSVPGIVENGISIVDNLILTDCIIETKVRFTDDVGFRAGIIFRYTDNEHYYTFELSNEYDIGTLTIYYPGNLQYGDNLAHTGGQYSYPIQAGTEYLLRVEIQGNTFRCFINDVEVCSGTDGTYGSGKVGLKARRAVVFFDNFTVLRRGKAYFFDDFDGTSIDTTKWVAEPNEGSIEVANSSVILSSEGSTFPTVYTRENPFPMDGNFMLEFDLTYTRATGDGTGFWVSNGPWEIPPSIPNILLIWQDALVFSSFRYLRVWLLGNLVFNSSNVDLFRHQFLLEYLNQTYVLYMDRIKLASATSSLRPDVIGFGHPPPIPSPYPRPWTSFNIDKIAVYTLPPYSLSVNTFKNDVPITSNMTLLDENKTIIQTVNGVSTYDWLLPSGTYYGQASIFYNGFAYASEQIQVNLTSYIELAINFLFGNLTISCLDIKNRPLSNCTVIFARETEQRVRHTNSSGLTTLEAYYGNWTVKAYWMDVLVGEANIHVNQTEMDLDIRCKVGDLTVIVVDQYGSPIEANVTLRNIVYDLTFSGYVRKPMENITFTQIPLTTYNLTIKDDFGTQTYLVNTEQTRQIQMETLPLQQKLVYIILGIIAGIGIGSLGVWMITKRKRTKTVK